MHLGISSVQLSGQGRHGPWTGGGYTGPWAFAASTGDRRNRLMDGQVRGARPMRRRLVSLQQAPGCPLAHMASPHEL